MGLSKCSSIPPLIIDGNLLTDGIAKCEAFNEFFSTQCNLSVPVYANEFLDIQDKIATTSISESIYIDAVTMSEDEIKNILMKLDVNKARGSDLIGNRILKECSDVLSLPLFYSIAALTTLFFQPIGKKLTFVLSSKKTILSLFLTTVQFHCFRQLLKYSRDSFIYRLYDFCFSNKLLTPKKLWFQENESAMNQLIH